MENDQGNSSSSIQPRQHGQEEDVVSSHQAAPQPPPFNPLLSHCGQGQSLGHSVVPDLMQIYESLTQSKTPQTHADHPAGHAAPQYQQQQQHFQPPPPQQVYRYDQSNQYLAPAPAATTQGQQYGYGTPQPQPVSHMSSQQQQYGQADYGETARAISSGRSLRKRSAEKIEDDRSSSEESSSRSRKKTKADGRWSKRFTWPDDLHRDFVSAIFDVGLKHASPSAILEHMPHHDQINNERIKSHLQKYRLHRLKSKKEFMSCYESSLNNFQSSGVTARTLSSGEVAAHLTYSAMKADAVETPAPRQIQVPEPPESPQDVAAAFRSGALVLPKLTEAEKQSPMGASLGYLMGLFFSLRQQLMANRAAMGTEEGNDSMQINGQHPPMTVAPYVSYPTTSESEVAQENDMGVAAWPTQNGQPSDASQQQTSYQELQHDGVASKGAAASVAGHSSTRTNLEESHLMKRDMESQMAFQNKMRALKQQELNKVKLVSSDSLGVTDDDGVDGAPQTDENATLKGDEDAAKGGGMTDDHDPRYQGAGDGADTLNNPGGGAKAARSRHLSMGGEDFWVNDEQLFEFLMNS